MTSLEKPFKPTVVTPPPIPAAATAPAAAVSSNNSQAAATAPLSKDNCATVAIAAEHVVSEPLLV